MTRASVFPPDPHVVREDRLRPLEEFDAVQKVVNVEHEMRLGDMLTWSWRVAVLKSSMTPRLLHPHSSSTG